MTHKNTLLKEIMPNYLKWYKKVNSKIFKELDFELEQVFRSSGYYFQGRSTLGYLNSEIEIEKINKGLLSLLKKVNDSWSLRAYSLLAAYLGLKDSAQVIINIIEKEKNIIEVQKNLYCYIESLIILGVERDIIILIFDKIIVENLDIELKILYLNYLLEDNTKENAAIAYQIIKDHIFEYSCGEMTPVFIKINQHGFDTTEFKEYIISDFFYDDYYTVLWLEEIKLIELITEILLDSSQEGLLNSLLIRAIEKSKEWDFIIPILIKYRDQILNPKNFNISVQIPFVVLLDLYNIDIKEYYTSENWALRSGAYLTDLNKNTNKDYRKLLQKERDSDVLFIIKLNILKSEPLYNDNVYNLSENYLTLGYRLPQIIRILFNHDDFIFDYKLQCAQSIEEITSISKSNPKRTILLFKNSKRDIFKDKSNELDQLEINSSMGIFTSSLQSVNYYLEESFMKEHCFSISEMYLYYKCIIGFDFESQMIKDKEKLHMYKQEFLRLTQSEFNNLYHFLFSFILDEEYKNLIIKSSLSILRANPNMATTIFRHIQLDDDQHYYILNSLSAPRDNFSITLKDLYEGNKPIENILEIIDIYGFSVNFIPGIMTTYNSGLLPEKAAVNLLQNVVLCDIGYKIYEQCMNILKDKFTNISFIDFLISHYSECYTFSQKILLTNFLERNPIELYNPVCSYMLEDDDTDIVNAVHRILTLIN